MSRKQHPLYGVWKAMRKRCLSQSNPAYANYGGRGITICERWSDFWLFVEDVGERPDGYSLDRIDNNQGYCPENCRWASRLTQQSNRREGRYIRKTPYGFRVSITLLPYEVHARHFTSLSLAEDYRADCVYEREFHRMLSRCAGRPE